MEKCEPYLDKAIMHLCMKMSRSLVISGMAGAEAWHIKLLTNLLTVAARKNLILSGRSFHTAPKTIRGRVLAYLNSVSLQKKNTEFDIPFDRQQLADYLNLERTALSKELGKMQREGLIECRKNHFRLIETGKKVGK